MPEQIHSCHMRCTDPDCVERVRRENEELVVALHDAIRRPLGVVPESAEKFYSPGVGWAGGKAQEGQVSGPKDTKHQQLEDLQTKVEQACEDLRAALLMLNERYYREGVLKVTGVLLRLEGKQ